MSHRSRLVPLLATMCLAIVATGCAEDVLTQPPRQGRVRILNAVGNLASLETFLDGDRMSETPVAYRGGTLYHQVEAGRHTLAVRPTGTTTNLLETAFEVAGEAHQTLIAAGRAGATSGPTPRFIVLTRDPVPSTNHAVLRFVHAAPSASPVDVYVTEPIADLFTATPLLTQVPFGAVSTPVTMPSGTYRFRLTFAGSKTVLVDVNNVALGPEVYAAIGYGDTAPGTGSATTYTIGVVPMSAPWIERAAR